jgi:hypothetical protein
LEKDSVVAILGSAVGLAGILLVFVGFIYSHGESFSSDTTKGKYKFAAKLGLIPFTVSLVAAWFGLRWLETSYHADYVVSLWSFKACLVLTLVYGAGTLLRLL